MEAPKVDCDIENANELRNLADYFLLPPKPKEWHSIVHLPKRHSKFHHLRLMWEQGNVDFIRHGACDGVFRFPPAHIDSL